MYLKKMRLELRWSAHWDSPPLAWVRASREPHRLHLSSRGLCGSKIEAMGTIGAAMATVETGATVEAGATVETGVTDQGGAASLVRLGTSPGARSRVSCPSSGPPPRQ